jgi:D-serine deaminase-like pyridoxal phosphate-dependent protein
MVHSLIISAEIDSPALVVYMTGSKQNIALADTNDQATWTALRPHVKTNKIAEVCQLMLDEGITKIQVRHHCRSGDAGT